MPFAYYDNLSKRDQSTYRASDALGEVLLPDPESVRPAVAALEKALKAEDRKATQAASTAIAAAIVRSLAAPRVRIKVLARRPTSASEELHGLYTYEEGETPEIRVWMRTAARKEVVRFRTFLRTLLHELCHHLDFAHFELRESFHTEGFFRRESSLMRQLAPPAAKKKAGRRTQGKGDGEAVARAASRGRGRAAKKAAQLELPMTTPKAAPARR